MQGPVHGLCFAVPGDRGPQGLVQRLWGPAAAAAAAVMHGRASDAVPWESAAAFIGQAVWFKVI